MGTRGTWISTHVRLVGLVAAVLVVAGATGGYLGLTSATTRTSSPGPRSGRPHTASASHEAADALTPETGNGTGGSSAGFACPMIPAPTNGAVGSGAVGSGAVGSGAVGSGAEGSGAVGSGAVGSGAVGSGAVGSGAEGSGAEGSGAVGSGDIGSATHLFTRTTGDGVTIRTYRLPATGACGCGPVVSSSADPTSSGAATAVVTPGAVSVELSDDTAVGEGTLFSSSDQSAVTSDAGTGPVDAVSDVFGVAEGAPVWWTAVSVGPDVADATMTFADGSTDEMVPVDGVVVLARPIDPTVASSGDGPDVVRGTLRLSDAAGTVVTTVVFPEPTPAPVPLPIAVPGSPPVAHSGPVTAPTPQTTEGVATTSCS